MKDYWNIDMVGRTSHERTGWPTQKPLALLERIIAASSNPGDLVLDPFAGCATTCIAAENLGRQWAGIDIDSKAHEVTVDRLAQEVTLETASPRRGRAVLSRCPVSPSTELLRNGRCLRSLSWTFRRSVMIPTRRHDHRASVQSAGHNSETANADRAQDADATNTTTTTISTTSPRAAKAD